jgi:hypothetical protein
MTSSSLLTLFGIEQLGDSVVPASASGRTLSVSPVKFGNTQTKCRHNDREILKGKVAHRLGKGMPIDHARRDDPALFDASPFI